MGSEMQGCTGKLLFIYNLALTWVDLMIFYPHVALAVFSVARIKGRLEPR